MFVLNYSSLVFWRENNQQMEEFSFCLLCCVFKQLTEVIAFSVAKQGF